MKDYDFIKNRFDRDGLESPESISPDALRRRLADLPQTEPPGRAAQLTEVIGEQNTPGAVGAAPPVSRRPANADPRPAFAPKHPWRRPLIAFAACACLTLALIPVYNALTPGLPGASSADDTGLLTFSSQRQLDRAVKGLVDAQYSSQVTVLEGLSGRENLAEAPDYAADSAAGSAENNAAAPKDSASTPDHSTTYTQVEDVDEADIVKTDGRCIYYVSRVENQVIIARAKDGKTKRIAAVSNHGNVSTIDLYIHDDQLIIIGRADGDLLRTQGSQYSRGSTIMSVYDVSDPADPQKTGQYIQTGNLLSSRLVDGRVCLVTNDPVYSAIPGGSVPQTSAGSELTPVPLEDIRCFPDAMTPAYTVISLIDTSGKKVTADRITTSAILGGSEEIYCSGPSLYVTGDAETDRKAGEMTLLPERLSRTESRQTRILRISLAKGKLKNRATGIVPGRINNSFSMDEYRGCFRIATTSSQSGQDVNNLFILDEKLKETGSLQGFAPGEHIEAVRYLGNTAYVITYEQTDPLFIVDLRDAKNPTIQGHVKISGFSTLLMPTDKQHLLGFGFSTETGDFGEYTNGLKLALFNISDLMNPTVADTLVRTGVSSPIQYNHRALLVGSNADFYAIPYEAAFTTVRDDVSGPTDPDTDGGDVIINDAEEPDSADEEYTGSKSNSGILMISTRGGRIKVLRDIPTQKPLSRCIYIGDWFYGITWDDDIEAFPIG